WTSDTRAGPATATRCEDGCTFSTTPPPKAVEGSANAATAASAMIRRLIDGLLRVGYTAETRAELEPCMGTRVGSGSGQHDDPVLVRDEAVARRERDVAEANGHVCLTQARLAARAGIRAERLDAEAERPEG